MDTRIVKYNVDLCYKDYKYAKGCVAVDLSDIDNMRARIIAEWSMSYAEKHLLMALGEATGIHGGWSLPQITSQPSGHDNGVIIYDFTIKSRLYKNLRRIYERRPTG